jgi:hypothetical protein
MALILPHRRTRDVNPRRDGIRLVAQYFGSNCKRSTGCMSQFGILTSPPT